MYHPEWQRRLLSAGIGLLLPLSPAIACGPDFPYLLLNDRQNALAQMPEGSFVQEIRKLGATIPGLGRASEATLQQYPGTNDRLPIQREEVEKSQLQDGLFERVQRLRALTEAAQVESQGAELPAELRLYTAGAVAFAQGDHWQAAEHFQRVLALPAEQRKLRSTWAAYSLGRSLALMSGEATDTNEPDLPQRAAAAFELTRQLAIEGFDDPLELALASLGEQARLYLHAGEWSQAIALYASQAIHGSETGTSSLREVGASLAALDDQHLRPLLHQQAVRQLLSAKLLAGIQHSSLPAERLLTLIQQTDIQQLDDADRLAAIAYREGNYASTQRFLDRATDSGLTWWLRAKMALRAGDSEAASQAYAEAAKGFPEDENWGWRRNGDWLNETLKPKCRIEGESAILALERGDYLQAFEQLYRGGDIYWQDAAAVAERVLTTDELKGYVDSQVASAPQPVDSEPWNYWDRPTAMRLRELLARRLMRDGRYDEARGYFAQAEQQQAAADYQQARERAQSAWTDIGRAEAYFEAASLLRRQGMELLGYELGPDNYVYAGNYPERYNSAQMISDAEPIETGGLLSAAEAQRWNATAAAPYRRFHYRWIAADLASSASDLLPERSQAFASTLCAATDWMINVDPQRAQSYYRRYVEQGALRLPPAPAFVFGVGACETPDFQAARKRQWIERGQAVRQVAYEHQGALTALSIAVVGVAIYWRRRAKKAVAKMKE
ncbi:hypothetical protein [Pseudomonas sp. PA1(2017)]|uniref:hypothetical protein n=1 Tax=Pseudomonas sp. PA1(2017) TaxID=1932113 RepID=UPI000AA61CDE|nr:hypothetical protein [Pseudomonas sp. PA1(2017)]